MRGVFGDPLTRIVVLARRREKAICQGCGASSGSYYDHTSRLVRDLACGGHRIYLEVDVRRVDCVRCGGVKRERLEWLADNPRYTRRFAMLVGCDRRCRTATIKDVARGLHLHWEAVKELEKEYMAEQMRRAGSPAPEVIGIDEISIRKGHTYRIVVSDLIRGRPIWFGGLDRSEGSLAMFYTWLGPRKGRRVRLAIMHVEALLQCHPTIGVTSEGIAAGLTLAALGRTLTWACSVFWRV